MTSFCDFKEEGPADDATASDACVEEKTEPLLLWLSQIPLFENAASSLNTSATTFDIEKEYQTVECQKEGRTCFCADCRAEWLERNKPAAEDHAEDWIEENADPTLGINMADATIGPDGRILQLKPEHYERYTSFLTTKDPMSVLLTFRSMFENDARIDVEMSEKIYQLRVTVWRDEKNVEANITIFKEALKGEYNIVEFQCQNKGDSSDFAMFYRQYLAQFSKIPGAVFLFVPVLSLSSGIFNFTPDVDGNAVFASDYTCESESKSEEPSASSAAASASSSSTASASATASAISFPGFKVDDVDEYIYSVTQSLRHCQQRLCSVLVEARNEALRTVVLSTGDLKPIVYEDIDLALEILTTADADLTHCRGLGTEMSRCLATIASNLCCDKPQELMKRWDKSRLHELRKGVREELVPKLMTFWDNYKLGKRTEMKRETDKQIVRLLGILYYNDQDPELEYDIESTEKVYQQALKRLELMEKELPHYTRMKEDLEKTIAAMASVLRQTPTATAEEKEQA